MRRATAACLACAVAVLVPPALAPRAQQVFRARTDAVTVDVSVESKREPVRGLTATDFAVRDNGVAQDVELLQTEALPLDVTLLLDLSGSVNGLMLSRLKTAVGETAAELGPDDRLRLVGVSNRLRQVFGLRPGGTPPPLEALHASGATSLYDGIVAAMMKPREADRRQLIVAFTDGRDTLSFFDAQAAERIARLSDAVVHIAVGVNGRLAASTRNMAVALPNRRTLDAIADATGGAVDVFDLTQSIGDVFTDLIRRFRTGYVLVYTPKDVTRAGWHDITVEITKPGGAKYDIKARRGYLGG